MWLCECECGNTKLIGSANLISGNTLSCGCYNKEIVSELCANRLGKNNPGWKHDLTDEDRLIKRNHIENKRWVKAVLERDNYTCRYCGKHGGELNAHHLYNYADYPEHRLDIDNGATLCKNCHDNFHFDFMGSHKVSCAPNDFYRWMREK